ncbi:MAG TPA: hypothetical protein VJX16_09170, partial [Terriglobales bacterium]|nr:hypothetical protein [Terriglobales bacterium]
GHQTAPVVRPLRRKPKARRDVRAQSVVPAVEAVRGLIVSIVHQSSETADHMMMDSGLMPYE